MFNINKDDIIARLKNPIFIAQVVISACLGVLTYYGLDPRDITTWGALFNLIGDALSNPYVVGFTVFSIFSAFIDTKSPFTIRKKK